MDKMKIHLIQMKIDELLAVCDEHNNDPGELINILHAAQGIFGYLPREVQEIIAGRLYIPVSKVYGVVTPQEPHLPGSPPKALYPQAS